MSAETLDRGEALLRLDARLVVLSVSHVKAKQRGEHDMAAQLIDRCDGILDLRLDARA